MVICLQTYTLLWLGGGTFSPSNGMYMGLMLLGTQKYTQQNYYCLNQVSLNLRWLLKIYEYFIKGVGRL